MFWNECDAVKIIIVFCHVKIAWRIENLVRKIYAPKQKQLEANKQP